MVILGDPNTVLFGRPERALDFQAWQIALELAAQAAAGTLEDITGGATNYYAESMKEPPYWAASMTKTCEIAGQLFFK